MNQNDDLIHLADLVNQFATPPPVRPHEVAISQTIAYIRNRMKNPEMDLPVNRAVKEGYTEALRILAEGIEDYAQIGDLTTVQGRAIAVLACDYLKGMQSQKGLCKVPLRK